MSSILNSLAKMRYKTKVLKIDWVFKAVFSGVTDVIVVD